MGTYLPQVAARLLALLALLVVCVPAARPQPQPPQPAPEAKEATPTLGELAERLRALEEASRRPPEAAAPNDTRAGEVGAPTATPAAGDRPATISDSPVPDYGDGLF